MFVVADWWPPAQQLGGTAMTTLRLPFQIATAAAAALLPTGVAEALAYLVALARVR